MVMVLAVLALRLRWFLHRLPLTSKRRPVAFDSSLKSSTQLRYLMSYSGLTRVSLGRIEWLEPDELLPLRFATRFTCVRAVIRATVALSTFCMDFLPSLLFANGFIRKATRTKADRRKHDRRIHDSHSRVFAILAKKRLQVRVECIKSTNELRNDTYPPSNYESCCGDGVWRD